MTGPRPTTNGSPYTRPLGLRTHPDLRQLWLFVRSYDPQALLCGCARYGLIMSRHESAVPMWRGHMAQSSLELLQALILSIPPSAHRKRKPTVDTCNEFADLALKVTHEVIQRFDTNPPGSVDELGASPQKVLKNIRLNRLSLRHSGYPQHISATMNALLALSNNELDKHFHVTFSSLIGMLDKTVQAIEIRYRNLLRGQIALLQATDKAAIRSVVDRYFPEAHESAYWLTRMTAPRLSRARRHAVFLE